MTDTTLREQIARAICRARPMPACECEDECIGPLDAILHPATATADIAGAVLAVIKQEHAAEIARLTTERDEALAEAHRARASIRAEATSGAAIERAVSAYDRARCTLYGRNDQPMSDANRESITPMICDAICAALFEETDHES